MYTSLPFLITNRNDNRKKYMVSLDMETVNSVEGSTGIAQNGTTNPEFTSPTENASNGSTVQAGGDVPSVYDEHTQRNVDTEATEKTAAPEAKASPDEDDPSGLYAVPDMSGKTSQKSKAQDDASACDSAGYASPLEVDNMESEEDLNALYATPSKHRPDEPEGGNTEKTDDLYAVPDKSQKSRTSNMNGLNGATNAVPDEDVAALYAVPDKRKTVDEDETVMIENELYTPM